MLNRLYRPLACTLLAVSLTTPALAEDRFNLADSERWINELSQQLLEKGAISGDYLNNYMQCLRDEKALREESNTLEQLWHQLMGTADSCAPVIEDMVNALNADDEEAEALRQRLKDLQQSL